MASRKRPRGGGHAETLQAVTATLPAARATLLSSALLPTPDGGYARKDVLLHNGKIGHIGDTGVPMPAELTALCPETIDCSERLLLPGFVNAHTHSIEHWARGLIKPLPLELWVQQLIRHEPRGDQGWHGADSFVATPSKAVAMSALHCGVEALLSGCTAILDHLFIRDMEDLDAAVQAYRALGIRAFIAPMLNDDAATYHNYIPRAPDAAARNEAAAKGGRCCDAMGDAGSFRTHDSGHDKAATATALALWEAAIAKHHRPEEGIEIVIGPVTAYSASRQLFEGAAALRRKHNLCGHTHLLETRAQA